MLEHCQQLFGVPSKLFKLQLHLWHQITVTRGPGSHCHPVLLLFTLQGLLLMTMYPFLRMVPACWG
jgi:hypothetical protein